MIFLLTPLREGRPRCFRTYLQTYAFLLTPLREGRRINAFIVRWLAKDFYSRPCGRGDALGPENRFAARHISTHAPAGGATSTRRISSPSCSFLLTPLREGRRGAPRPGGVFDEISTHAPAGGATGVNDVVIAFDSISTHAPAGGATRAGKYKNTSGTVFLLTPLREGRRRRKRRRLRRGNFYSRPCGRGDPFRTPRAR